MSNPQFFLLIAAILFAGTAHAALVDVTLTAINILATILFIVACWWWALS